MISPETRQKYLELLVICEQIDVIADRANLSDKHEDSLRILIKNIFKGVVKVDTYLPILKSQEYTRGQYQLRSYGLVKGEREYGYYTSEPRYRYFSQNVEKLLRIIRQDGLEIASKLEKMSLNTKVKNEQKMKQLVEFIRDCSRVDFNESYDDLSKKYTPTNILTIAPSAFMSTDEDNESEELKHLNIQVEPQSGSLRVELVSKSGAEFSLIDSADSDYSWINPLMFLRLDDTMIKFVREALLLFKLYVQKKYSGGGQQVERLVEKYGQYIVLEKLGDDTSK